MISHLRLVNHPNEPLGVWGRSCVLAGYNAMIPALCPELPKPQREALAVKLTG
jgi:hypothetical protein